MAPESDRRMAIRQGDELQRSCLHADVEVQRSGVQRDRHPRSPYRHCEATACARRERRNRSRAGAPMLQRAGRARRAARDAHEGFHVFRGNREPRCSTCGLASAAQTHVKTEVACRPIQTERMHHPVGDGMQCM